MNMKKIILALAAAALATSALAQEVIKQYPDYEKTVKDMFPDFTFEVSSEE